MVAMLMSEPFWFSIEQIGDLTDEQIDMLMEYTESRDKKNEPKPDEPETYEDAKRKFLMAASVLGESNLERAERAFEEQWSRQHGNN